MALEVSEQPSIQETAPHLIQTFNPSSICTDLNSGYERSHCLENCLREQFAPQEDYGYFSYTGAAIRVASRGWGLRTAERGRLEAIGLNYGLIYTLSPASAWLVPAPALGKTQMVFILSFYRSFSFYRLFGHWVVLLQRGAFHSRRFCLSVSFHSHLGFVFDEDNQRHSHFISNETIIISP